MIKLSLTDPKDIIAFANEAQGDNSMNVVYHTCPACGAKENENCRTPKGRKKQNVHDTRGFSVNGDFLG